MTTVVATGVFSIIHPGHILYLKEAKKLGDELVVIVARDSTVKKRKNRIIPEKQRLEVVKALRMVDRAILGDEFDIFKPIEEIKPDIIALGKDQYFNQTDIERELKGRGLNIRVVRIQKQWASELNSSKKIIERIKHMD